MQVLEFPAEEERRNRHHHQKSRWRKRGGGRVEAGVVTTFPDRVVNSGCSESNPFFIVNNSSSIFSLPGSSSVDRCSFESDLDPLFPHLSFVHLAGSDDCGGPEPEKRASFDITATTHNSKGTDVTDRDVDRRVEEEEEETILDPVKHSFSLALKDCQNRRFISEGIPLPEHRSRPTSLDLSSQGSDASISSPRSYVAGGGMKKSSAVSAHIRSGTFPSPGAPIYRHGIGTMGYQKGWSSERVPLPANSGRRYGSSAALLPFGNGRALPSKWEDAEKWILSPVSSHGVNLRSSALAPHHRRPKSKSGPLGTPAVVGGSYSSVSPLVPGFDSCTVRNFAANSPLLTGVLVAEHGCCSSIEIGGASDGGGGRSDSAQSDHCMVRSASMHEWSDLLESESSLPSSQDEKHDSTKDASTTISSVVCRKDMGTQMSPEGSTNSSPKERPYSPPPLPQASHTVSQSQSNFSNLEVRDVQVDDRVTVIRWSKKHIARGLDKGSVNILQWKKKTADSKESSAWEVMETAKCISKIQREEAKITAWENLQKAKAEAAIRKLEMKLEKKRSSSMDRILNKLRSAQEKAQEMRNAVTTDQADQVAATPQRRIFFRKPGQMGSLSGCFVCHAF